MPDVVDNSQPGFMTGLSNLFDNVVGKGAQIAKVYTDWTFIREEQAREEAERELAKLQANVALTSQNTQLLKTEQFSQILKYGIFAVAGIGGIFLLRKVLK